MKMLRIFLSIIGLTRCEELHRKYLSPPGSTFLDENPDVIDIPLELTDHTYYSCKDEEITTIPELVIGIDRGTVTPNDTFEDISNNMNDNIIQHNNNTSAVSYFSHATPIRKSFEKYSLNVPSVETLNKIQGPDGKAFIINYDQSVAPDGYAYSYDTSNGIHGEEEGTATNGVKAKGSYSYIGDDGNLYQVEYTADENGFVPKGAHLPTAPPIPDAILRVIEIALKNKKAGVYDNGSYDDEKYGYQNYVRGFSQTYNTTSSVSYSIGDGNNNMRGDLINENLYDGENNISKSVVSSENGISDINFKRNEVNGDITDMNGIFNKNNSLHSYDRIHNKKFQDNISQPYLDTSTNKSKKKLLENVTDNEYFSPQSPKFRLFPSRFSKMDDKEIKENKTDMVTTPIPFLTPYVSRIDDDELETSDIDENHEDDDSDYDQNDESPGENLENYGVGSKHSKKSKDNGSLDEKFVHAPQYGDRIGNNNEIVPSQATTPFVDIHFSSIKPGLILSSKSIQTLKPRQKFSTSNRPNNEYPIIFNVQTSTEIIIGEDFNGPEQPQ